MTTNPTAISTPAPRAIGDEPLPPPSRVLADQLDGLLERQGPRIALEPIVHLQTGAEIGVEALARFDIPFPPALVFRAAHAAGLGIELELRCLHRVLEYVHTTNATDAGFVGVNLSPSVLIDPRCLDLIRLYRSRRVVIELTDHAAAAELPALRRCIDEARDHDIRIAVHVSSRIDHDLLAIVQPEIAKVRISSSSPNTAATDSSELARHMSHLGTFVVAVGVDSRDSLTHLRLHGIDAAQGHMISLPRIAA